jgi:hypothetical protein
LGSFEDFKKTKTFKKGHTIGRHKDGPNDHRRGYKWTAVFGCLVVVDGKIYRLAIIAYTRNKVGAAVETETKCLDELTERLSFFLESRAQLKDVDLRENGEQWECCYGEEKDAGGESFKTTGRRYPSFADPHAYWSAAIDAMRRLNKFCDPLPRSFWVELFLVILRHNSASMLHNILSRWLPNGSGAQRFADGLKKGYGPHTLFKMECDHSGIGVTEGACIRMQWCMGFHWPDQRDGANVANDIAKDVATLDEILKDAEKEDFLHEDIIERLEGIDWIGPTKSLTFYLIATTVGLLTSKHAIRESYFAKLTSTNPAAAEIEHEDAADLHRKFKRLTWKFALEQYLMENACCKEFRVSCKWDFIADGQTVYRKEKHQEGNREMTIFYKKDSGGVWQQYTPYLRFLEE